MLALSESAQDVLDVATLIGAIVGAFVAIGLLARMRPVRWIFRHLVGEPVAGYFRNEVTSVVLPLHQKNLDALAEHTEQESLIVKDAIAALGKVNITANKALVIGEQNRSTLDEVLNLAIAADDQAKTAVAGLARVEAHLTELTE